MNATITLDFPVEFQGQRISTLTMRRPKVIDRLTADKTQGTDLEQEIVLFANLCGIEKELIYEIDQDDYKKLGEAFSGFFTKPTAEKSSTPA